MSYDFSTSTGAWPYYVSVGSTQTGRSYLERPSWALVSFVVSKYWLTYNDADLLASLADASCAGDFAVPLTLLTDPALISRLAPQTLRIIDLAARNRCSHIQFNSDGFVSRMALTGDPFEVYAWRIPD